MIPYRTDFDGEAQRVAEQVRARRGGTLLNLDRMLLHCPAITEGWGALMGTIRQGARIPAKHRELAICAVAALNGADYEAHAHIPVFTAAGGALAQIQALRDTAAAAADETLFDAAERAVLRFAIDSTTRVAISPETMAMVKASFPSPEEIVELTMIVASYNMVSRFLVALGVEIEGRER
jgi:alkylhydroperoxidase family enzyme